MCRIRISYQDLSLISDVVRTVRAVPALLWLFVLFDLQTSGTAVRFIKMFGLFDFRECSKFVG